MTNCIMYPALRCTWNRQINFLFRKRSDISVEMMLPFPPP